MMYAFDTCAACVEDWRSLWCTAVAQFVTVTVASFSVNLNTHLGYMMRPAALAERRTAAVHHEEYTIVIQKRPRAMGQWFLAAIRQSMAC